MELNVLKTFFIAMYLSERERKELKEKPLAIPNPEFDLAAMENSNTWKYIHPIQYVPIKEEEQDYELIQYPQRFSH